MATFGTGGVFGQSTTGQFGQSGTTGAFGQAGTTLGQPATTPFGQSSTTSTPFGQSSTTTPFGQSGTTSAFGQSSTATTPFGQSNTTPFGQSSTTTPFGQTGTTSSFGQTGTTSAFGQSSTTTPFGQSSTTTPFGQSSTTTPFGQPSSSLFGQSAPASTPFGQSSSLFGQTSTTTPFGQSSTTTPFGQSSSTPFGQTSTPSLFGQSSSSSLFGQPASTFGQQQQQQQLAWGAAKSVLTPQQKIEAISNAFNPDHANCRFKHAVMYNRVNENEAHQYTKPPNVDEKVWQQAVDANPDPSRLVPVQAIGFKDLKTRIEEQDKMTTLHQKALEEVQQFIGALQRKHDLETTVKLDQYKQQHMRLAHRVLKAMKKIEVLRCKGYSLSVDEEVFRSKLEALQRELDQPNHFKGRLNELGAYVKLQDDHAPEYYEPLDDESVETIYNFLAQQKSGLAHLTEVMKTCFRDLNIMSEMLKDTHSDVK